MDMFWKNQDWEKHDRHLSGLSDAPFQRPFPKITLTPGVAIIRGPRQIGKSSWVKSILSKEVRKGVNCFYYSCENLVNHIDLAELLNGQSSCDLFILDEISFVTDWWRAIKRFTDTHHTKKILLTGSNSFDLKKGMDLMPGRWMKDGGEHQLLPMDYFEWCDMRKQAGWRDLDFITGLEMYFRIGGFPSALIEAGEEGKKPVQAMRTYQRWILGDLLKMGRQEVYLKELIGQLAKILTTPISLQKLAQKTQMMSYHTAQDYISLLEHCFALRTLYAYDPHTDTYRFKKEKKFYFTDPLIFWVAHDWAEIPPPENAHEKIAEMVAHEFLSRRMKRLGYLSTPKGEVDFVFNQNQFIEVKWSPVVKNLSKAFLSVPISNRKVWNQETFLRE